MLRLFGFGENKILSMGCCTKGTVTNIHECWWLSIKTKAVRICNTRENTLHPHIITFTYTVDNIPYTAKRYIPIRYRVPAVNEEFNVYYHPENPKAWAIYAFGPGNTQISW
jgi:hypothetical protein